MGHGDPFEIIGLIYDAALKPDIWPTVLEQLADLLKATSGAGIVSYNSQTRQRALLYPRGHPEFIRSFLEYWAPRCPILHYGRQHPVAAVMTPEMFVSRQEYCSTEIFNEWFKPQGAEAMMGAKLLIEGPLTTFFSLLRPYSSGHFEDVEIRSFAALVPHLQRAMQLQLRMAGVDGPPEGSVEILNQLVCGMLLVDAEARIIFANRAAERMLRDGGGLFLGHDGLRAAIPAETQALRRTIACCAKPGGEPGGAGGHLRLSRADRTPLTVLVIPHRSRLSWVDVVRPRAIVFIADPETAAAVSSEALREDFGLTPAEGTLALEILKADGLRAAATRLGVSLQTAHTQLAHVFDKTGTRRQAELVRVLLQSRLPISRDNTPPRPTFRPSPSMSYH